MKYKKVGNYEIYETLGRGTFSKVKRAFNFKTNQNVAIKIVKIDLLKKEGMEKQIRREILALKKLVHPNIVALREVLKSSKNIYLIQELISGGELFDKIVEQKKFSEQIGRKYFQQLVFAIKYSHENGIVHRDLKPENLMLSQNGDLKVTDFGLSSVTNPKPYGFHETICGTPSNFFYSFNN